MPLIICPNCQHEFAPESILEEQIEKKVQLAFQEKWKTAEKLRVDKTNAEKAELQKQLLAKDAEITAAIANATKETTATLHEKLRKEISSDYANQISMLQQAKNDSDERIKQANDKELAYLQKEKTLELKQQQIEIDTQKLLNEKTALLRAEIQQQEAQKIEGLATQSNLKIKELEEKIEAQKKLVTAMQRKAEQGSMQSQGEAQELLLEEVIKQTFPFDIIEEVSKGSRGADCLQTVRNSMGTDCGKIYYESKRTQNFGGDWIEKLKIDMLACHADIGILVTQTMPKDMSRFGEKQGIYICSFAEVKALAHILRLAVIKVNEAKKSQENKGDKMVMLYNYLTGIEFIGQWTAIINGFKNLQNMLDKEKDEFMKNWAKKKKQFDLIIENSLQISGSMEGIAGADKINISLIQHSSVLADEVDQQFNP